jgi:hypothetical protein
MSDQRTPSGWGATDEIFALVERHLLPSGHFHLTREEERLVRELLPHARAERMGHPKHRCDFCSRPIEPTDDAVHEVCAAESLDALRKSNYRDVDPKAVGPMSERDAFKCTVRWLVNDIVGRHVKVES